MEDRGWNKIKRFIKNCRFWPTGPEAEIALAIGGKHLWIIVLYKSVPLYEKIGHLANVESYFTIKNDENHYTAEDFLRISNDDGSIIYLI